MPNDIRKQEITSGDNFCSNPIVFEWKSPTRQMCLDINTPEAIYLNVRILSLTLFCSNPIVFEWKSPTREMCLDTSTLEAILIQINYVRNLVQHFLLEICTKTNSDTFCSNDCTFLNEEVPNVN